MAVSSARCAETDWQEKYVTLNLQPRTGWKVPQRKTTPSPIFFHTLSPFPVITECPEFLEKSKASNSQSLLNRYTTFLKTVIPFGFFNSERISLIRRSIKGDSCESNSCGQSNQMYESRKRLSKCPRPQQCLRRCLSKQAARPVQRVRANLPTENDYGKITLNNYRFYNLLAWVCERHNSVTKSHTL